MSEGRQRKVGMRRLQAAALVRPAVWGFCLLLCSTARAQISAQGGDSVTTSSDGDLVRPRALARTRGYAGLDAFQRGNWALARTRLEEAFTLYPAPSLGLWLARTHVRLGELNPAARLYGRVTALPRQEHETGVQITARDSASLERKQLLPRLPTLELAFSGGDPKSCRIWVDDTPIDYREHLVFVDPGPHRVRVSSGGREAGLEVRVAESEHREVTFFLTAQKDAAPPRISVQLQPGKQLQAWEIDRGPIASPAPATDEARARELGYAGLGAYRDGQFATALEQLRGAFALLPLPAYALFAARSANELGQVLDALSLYHLAKEAAGAPAFSDGENRSRSEATAEHQQLLARLPLLRILLVDALRTDVSVTLDGELLESTAIGEEWAVNPGKHTLVARRGEETLRVEPQLGLKQRRDVVLQFRERVTAPAPDGSPAASRSPE